MIFVPMILCGKGMASHREQSDTGSHSFTTRVCQPADRIIDT